MLDSILKLRQLLDRRDAKRLLGLFCAILAMALLQVVGIASVLPFMKLVADPNAIAKSEWLRWAYKTGGFESPSTMLLAAGAAVLFLLALANALSALTTWLQQKWAWLLAHSVSVRLVKMYSRLPYEFFLTHHSAELIRKVCTDVAQLVTGVLLAGSELIAHAILSLVIVLLLVIVEPWLAVLSLIVLATIYGIFFVAGQARMRRLGRDRLQADYRRYKSFVDVISGIKAVKTDGATDYFVNRFESASQQFSAIQIRFQVVSLLPRYVVETIAFGGVLFMVLYLLAVEGNLTAALPVLSMFALATYRLVPAVNKIFTAATNIRHNLPVIDEIYRDISYIARQAEPQRVGSLPEFTSNIELANLSFAHSTSQEQTISKISLSIPAGSLVGFVGPTGSGKTTLIDVLVGLLPPGQGQLSVDDTPITPENVGDWQQQIGYVPQDVFLYDETVARNIAFGVEEDKINMERVRNAARAAQIDDFIMSELRHGYDTEVGDRGVRLSGGQRQRIGLARAMYRAPRVLLLDEATSALDGVTEEAVIQSVQRQTPKLTVIIVTHRLSTVRPCDHIYFFEQGRIVAQGSYEELISSEPRFREMIRAIS